MCCSSRTVSSPPAPAPIIFLIRNSLCSSTLADSAEALLQAYAWPGNTRELENAIHFALLVNGSGLIEADDISLTQ